MKFCILLMLHLFIFIFAAILANSCLESGDSAELYA